MNNKIMSQEQINFEQTGLSIPESVLKLSLEKQTEVYNYLIQMSESQKKAYLIAKDHLGTSFNVLKSNGFSEWKKSKN
jgi:competence protein ComGC